tara:strand:+ start:15444 stop:16556 length:1113 start_codon:yes stop_codon:yes gene_type:complete
MENKPEVFPVSSKMTDAMKEANETGSKIAEQALEEKAIIAKHKPQGELNAQAQMNKDSNDRLEEQLKLRDALIAQKKAEAQGIELETTIEAKPKVTYSQPKTKSHKKIELSDDDKYAALSIPQEDVPYDLLKLPSEGLLYKNGKSALKVAYLTAMDENIITNPNLLQSGKFLEILINRKVLDTNLRYKDLHVGDRNAIMIWLRSTGFGPMYKIKLNDPKNNFEEFETDIDLSKLGIKHLTEKPDENGHFKFKLPVAQTTITYRLLNVGDVEDIEEHLEQMTEDVGPEFTDTSTYTLSKQILAVDDDFDRDVVEKFVEKKMRLGDVRAFRKHINEIESGIDMNITVETPGGGSIATFLPLNLSFFWPELGI